ncbi:MAG: hypothetical protein FWE20_00375 [Defluviitaleaceae bacterium]|nr:hypothetical protein [Defluviitaleaceae bacterium]
MAYDTKVLLIAIAEIVKKSESKREIYDTLAKMANAEGVVLEPFDEQQGG